jgi:isopentenyl diphosphate isomerase/L-lactate dehydrogenase-like FMN-dependent dehydrogenase
VPVNIAELERRARRLLTPEVYDYYAGGVGREQTLRANVRAWRQYWLLPRVLRDVSVVDTSVRRGEDVLTALSLGAHAVFLGRPLLWALACDGADGVRDLLTGITADLAHAMALAGARTLTDVAGVTAPTTAHSLDT